MKLPFRLLRQSPTPSEFIGLMLQCVTNPKIQYTKSLLKFEPRDVWVGIFWDATNIEFEYAKDFVRSTFRYRVNIFVCPLPCCLIRFAVELGTPRWKRGDFSDFNRGRDITNAQLSPEHRHAGLQNAPTTGEGVQR